MQDLILIFSKCEKVKNGISYFHFKGFYSGKKIKFLSVRGTEEDLFEINNNYLLWAQKIDIIKGELRLRLIKHKKIF